LRKETPSEPAHGGKRARNIQKTGSGWSLPGSLKSGAHVQIEDELRSREYEKDGVSHRIWECKASRIAKPDRIERADETSSGDENSDNQATPLRLTFIAGRVTPGPFFIPGHDLQKATY
jgi:hypothetical protein